MHRTDCVPSQKLPGFDELLKVAELRPDPTQESDVFETVYANAKEAQAILTAAIAHEWEVDVHVSTVKHPVAGTQTMGCIEEADDPGIKGEARSREKVETDYGGHANKLKDLARVTLRFTSPAKLVQTLGQLNKMGFKIVIVKVREALCISRWAHSPPSPRDLNSAPRGTLACMLEISSHPLWGPSE